MASQKKSSKSNQDNAAEQPARTLSPFTRRGLSAVIALHGIVVFISLSSGLAEYAISDIQPSQLQYALTGVLSPYTESLHLDIFGKPYYLTFARIDLQAGQVEGDYRVEVLPKGKDPFVEAYWKPVSETGLPGGASQRRFDELCRRLELYDALEEYEISGAIARQIAAMYKAQKRDTPDRVRVRRHFLLTPDQAVQGVEADAPFKFKTIYEAYVIADGDEIEVSRADEAAKVAIPK